MTEKIDSKGSTSPVVDLDPMQVTEVKTCGRTKLLRVACRFCSSSELVGFPVKHCPNCGRDLSHLPLAMAPKVRHTNVVALADTKRRVQIPKRVVQTLLEIQGRACAYCYDPFGSELYHVEHVKPWAFGGSNRVDNLVLACAPCNLAAGGLVFSSFADKRAYILTRRTR